MDTQELINRIQDYVDDVDSTDGDNTAYRLRVLQWAQQSFEYLWNYRSWRFKIKNSTVTISASGTSAALPSDFQEFGIHGGVYRQNANGQAELPKLEEVAPQEIQTGQATTGTTSKPTKYAVFQASSGLYNIQTAPLTSAITFDLWYVPVAPTLVDSDTNSKLEDIPVGYHFSVVLAAVMEKAARDKGDARAATEWATTYRDGLKRMVERETTGAASPQRMPRASIGMW